MIRGATASTAAALLAAASFALGLWTLIRLEPPAVPEGDYNVHFDVSPVSVGLLLAGLALAGLCLFLRKRAANTAARAGQP